MSEFDLGSLYGYILLISRYLIAGLSVLVLGSCVISLLTRQFGKRVGSYLQNIKTGEKIPLKRWENSIGRSNSCDVVFDDPAVGRFHAVISKRRKGWVLADTNLHPDTAVNDNPISDRYLLSHGDIVKFGSLKFKFVDADMDDLEQEEKKKRKAFSRRAARYASGMPQEGRFLPALVDEAADNAYVIAVDSCVFGRSTGCDCQLKYNKIDLRHLRIYSDSGSWYAENLSPNGTRINSVLFTNGSKKLKDGDIISMGGVLFVFKEFYKVKKR